MTAWHLGPQSAQAVHSEMWCILLADVESTVHVYRDQPEQLGLYCLQHASFALLHV